MAKSKNYTTLKISISTSQDFPNEMLDELDELMENLAESAAEKMRDDLRNAFPEYNFSVYHHF